MFIAIFYLVSLIVGALVALLQPSAHTLPVVAETLLHFVLLIGVGITLVIGGLGHAFRSDFVAQKIGWPTGSPFQKELGFWDFAAGIGAIIAFWSGREFMLATILINAIFWISAGVLHIQHVIQHRNYNADNAIPAVADILVPITLIGLFLLAR
jgi:hypothetical protein